MESFFWATITPTQAVIMALGYEPPYPKTLPNFVKTIMEKEGVFDEEDLKFLEKIIKYRKDLEHGKIKELEGKLIDELKEEHKKFFSKMKRLYREILLKYRKHELLTKYQKILSLLKLLYGIDKVHMIEPLIKKGKIDHLVLEYLEDIRRFEENNELTDNNIEVLWKAFRIIERNLEDEYEKIRKEKLSKLVLRGQKDGKEVIILILKDGIAISEDSKTVKIYYYDGRQEEKLFNEVFDEVLRLAENLEDVPLNLKKLAELGVEVIL